MFGVVVSRDVLVGGAVVCGCVVCWAMLWGWVGIRLVVYGGVVSSVVVCGAVGGEGFSRALVCWGLLLGAMVCGGLVSRAVVCGCVVLAAAVCRAMVCGLWYARLWFLVLQCCTVGLWVKTPPIPPPHSGPHPRLGQPLQVWPSVCSGHINF